jgi:hypothetical protein
MAGTRLDLHAQQIVDDLLRRNAGRWESLSAADRERVARLARTVAARLLERPSRRPAEAAELFGLD